MIPGRKTSRYKRLARIRIDIWGSIQRKTLKKEKWKPLRRILKKKKKAPSLLGYYVRPLSKFPVYYRYLYKNTIYIKQGLKIFYGSLQDYRIKAIVQRGKMKGSDQIHVLREFEHKLASFLYSLKVVSTFTEARMHCLYQRVLVNKSKTQNVLKKGDFIEFSSYLKKIVKRRFLQKRLKFLPFEMDFDAQSMRFRVIEEKRIFSHPFMHKFKRVLRWYNL